jgi:hypothetical protein
VWIWCVDLFDVSHLKLFFCVDGYFLKLSVWLSAGLFLIVVLKLNMSRR